MVYNYKSDEVVQDIIFSGYDTLISDISDEFSHLHRYDDITIYAPSNVAKEVVGRILDKIDGTFIHAESENYRLYNDDEVLISICSDGMIFVEEARWDDDELKRNDDCILTYVYDSFTKKDIDVLSESGDSILVFGFDDENEIPEEKNELEDTETSDVTTSTTIEESTSVYKVNGKEVSKEEYDKAVSMIESKYFDKMQEMLTNFNNWMDASYNILSVFR